MPTTKPKQNYLMEETKKRKKEEIKQQKMEGEKLTGCIYPKPNGVFDQVT